MDYAGYSPQDGDVVEEPYEDDSPEAMVRVIPIDGSPPFFTARKNVQGLAEANRFSVETREEIPESREEVVEPPFALPVLFLGILVGLAAGIALGFLIGVLVMA